MERIRIRGGRPLCGAVRVHGGKNAVLPILTATAAIRGRFILHNCPAIRDVEITQELLAAQGVTCVRTGDTLRVDSTGLRPGPIDHRLAGRLRSSVLFLGALLTAFGAAEIPLPGGCVLGARPLDLHRSGLESLGVETACESSGLIARGRPRSGTVILRYPSVGATENLLLAALGAAGPVRILGAAREPEIDDLCAFLTACDAELTGVGTACLTLTPRPLHGAEHR
ncbi:MAG: UDP-N-acetylglucosamine 1-carboxyvinyltransferase, partial [Oscillospiraceae bacterium]|nr:UDP-N-acetylglucosamine 1-carboxyvinyltransferase [Oscillospiraceae bacterium]